MQQTDARARAAPSTPPRSLCEGASVSDRLTNFLVKQLRVLKHSANRFCHSRPRKADYAAPAPQWSAKLRADRRSIVDTS